MSRWNTALRRARTLFWTSFSILIILAAVLVGIGKLLMPYSERYQPQLEAWLSQEFGQTVSMDSFTGQWRAFGPRLALRGLRLQAGAGLSSELAIAEAALDLKPLNALFPGRPLYNFLVIGADFRLVRKQQGEFELSGLGVSGQESGDGASALRDLIGIGELVLEDSSLEYVDEVRGTHLGLSGMDARLQLDDNDLAVELDARFQDETSHEVYGEISARGELRLATTRGLEAAKWMVTVRDISLAAFHGRLPENSLVPLDGRLNGEFWCDWQQQDELQVRGAVDLRNGLMGTGERSIAVQHIRSRLGWTMNPQGGWRLDFDGLELDNGDQAWQTQSLSIARSPQENLGLWISADSLPLGVPLDLARDIMALDGKDWPVFLPAAASGRIENLELVLDRSWHLLLAQGMVRQAGISGWNKWPDLAGIDGVLALEDGFGHVSLQADSLDVYWPGMFNTPLVFGLPACSADLSWGEQWQVNVQDCQLENEDLAVKADVLIHSNEGKPAVDVNGQLSRGRMDRLSPYWPEAIMGKNVLAWLRRSLIEGEISNGRLQIHGDMDNWPFLDGNGRFEAFADIQGVGVEYVRGWPRARGAEARARFFGSSMNVEGSLQNIGGVSARDVRASIANLKQPLLEVEYTAQSSLDLLVGFVSKSPLQEQLDTRLDQFRYAGPADTTGLLSVPLGSTAGELQIDGHVMLKDSEFFDPNSETSLTSINGELSYNRDGIEARELMAQFKGKPAQLVLSGNRNATERFRADMSGNFDVVDIIPSGLLQEHELLQQVQGQSDWLVSIVVPATEPGEESGSYLEVRSDLFGVSIDLPDPVLKTPLQSWPMQLRYPLNSQTGQLEVELIDRVLLQLEVPKAPEGVGGMPGSGRAAVSLGGGPMDLPPPGFIAIAGQTVSLDLDGWVDLIVRTIREGDNLAGLQLQPSEVVSSRLKFLDRLFDDVRLGVEVLPSGVQADFFGAEITGRLLLNTEGGSNASLSADFERLALDDPISGGVDVKTDPRELPALHLFASSFRYAGIEMGETRVEAYPKAQGFHFEKVEAHSNELNITASGDWLFVDDAHRSDFNIMMTSESLGQLMQTLDISTSLQGGQTVVHFNAWWPGSPAAFALSRLNGEVDFSVSRGQISNASAGTGRLLGLLSIQALPRRLSLDFRDVFDSGFDFEEATGTFRMENGTASTDDVELSSSVASISLVGSTDLVTQQYDQLMTVQPGLGNTLPIIGAIAGGPGGAAAGLALQGLLQKQLGEAAQVQYTIRGSWDEPLIEAVE